MSTLTFPTLLDRTNATTCTFSLVANTQTFQSPLNKTTQTSELPGARWMAALDFNSLTERDARLLKAFLAQLRGAAGRFYLGDLSYRGPRGTAAGAGLVKGASQSGGSIVTDGWTANQSGLFLPGDYVGVGGELKIVTVTASSDSSGNSTITFEPPQRVAPTDNSTIVVTRPPCVMRLKDDTQDKLLFDPERRPSLHLECEEVF